MIVDDVADDDDVAYVGRTMKTMMVPHFVHAIEMMLTVAEEDFDPYSIGWLVDDPVVSAD